MLINSLAMLLPFSPGDKQALLEAPSLITRRETLSGLMEYALAKGDEIVTSGGVLGKVSKLGESYLDIEVAKGVEMQVQRSAVVQVLPKGTIK